MSLLPSSTIAQPRVINKENVLESVANQIKNMTKSAFLNNLRTQRQGINLLWKNEHVTPQEIIDKLGDDAAKIFQFHNVLTTLLESIAQIDGVNIELALPSNAFTVSANGKITVTRDPYVKS